MGRCSGVQGRLRREGGINVYENDYYKGYVMTTYNIRRIFFAVTSISESKYREIRLTHSSHHKIHNNSIATNFGRWREEVREWWN